MMTSSLTIDEATQRYEAWLRTQTRIVKRDLEHKHEEMRRGAFTFLRATYYRWAGVWPRECPDLIDAPAITGVGDLHIENFGTWRDEEGRLAWGINDFDEAALLPYTNDLVRLATSAVLAHREGTLGIGIGGFCALLLKGYTAGLLEGGRPVVLDEGSRALRERMVELLVDPDRFWTKKMGSDLRQTPRPPAGVRGVLRHALHPRATLTTIKARVAGVGSLGRPRFVAIAEWQGGRIAREAKAYVPSAGLWAAGRTAPKLPFHTMRLLTKACRSRDPYLFLYRGWIVRRLAPDSDKVNLNRLASPALERQLTELMGRELANVHLATPGRTPAILRDLRARKSEWLPKAAAQMLRRTEEDYAAWRRR
jgi:Uncharacterized protein conserved in bacteria (DUF2252)